MRIFLKKLSTLKKQNYVYLTIIGLFLYATICYSKIQSLDVPIYHLDGAFQTASSLFRLLAWELPGRDFYPYLGIGPISLIYPIFIIAGANLCASVFASYFIVHIVGVFCLAVIIYLLWEYKGGWFSLVAACGLYSLPQLFLLPPSDLFGMYTVPDWLLQFLSPGNSLRPLRTFIPYLSIFMIYFFVFKQKDLLYKYINYGTTIGIISIWSNDYALVTVIFVFLLSLPSFISDSTSHYLKTAGYLILVSIISIILMQLIVTGGHPLKLAKYNFLYVAKDQWWYFGGWDESSKIFSLKDIKKINSDILNPFLFLILAINFISIFIFKRLRLELLLLFSIGLLLLVGGILTCAGGNISKMYFEGFNFWAHIVGYLGGCRLIYGLTPNRLIKLSGRFLHTMIVILCILIVAFYALCTNKFLHAHYEARENNPNFIYVPELGGYLDQGWAYYIDYIRLHKEQTAIEEYFGIWSAMLKKPSIWPVDSVIHALGDVRELAENALQNKADVVITSNRKISDQWLGWNISANYWFYNVLFENYTPSFYSPMTIVWEKKNMGGISKNVLCKINSNGDGVILDVPNKGYYQVKFTIKIDPITKDRYIVMFNNNINFAKKEIGYTSISLNTDDQLLPVYAPTKGENEFKFSIRPTGTANLVIKSCLSKEIELKNSEILLMSEGDEKVYDQHFNDGTIYGNLENWDRGIYQQSAGFYIPENNFIFSKFDIGSVVQLGSGETRIVTSLAWISPYFQIYLNGEKLNPDKVGIPYQFTIVPENKIEQWISAIGDNFFAMTSENFKNGICLIKTGFIVPNTEINRSLFVPGNKVSIPNTTDRTIESISSSGVYLRVWLDGDLLDSTTAGLPSKFKVIE